MQQLLFIYFFIVVGGWAALYSLPWHVFAIFSRHVLKMAHMLLVNSVSVQRLSDTNNFSPFWKLECIWLPNHKTDVGFCSSNAFSKECVSELRDNVQPALGFYAQSSIGLLTH